MRSKKTNEEQLSNVLLHVNRNLILTRAVKCKEPEDRRYYGMLLKLNKGLGLARKTKCEKTPSRSSWKGPKSSLCCFWAWLFGSIVAFNLIFSFFVTN